MFKIALTKGLTDYLGGRGQDPVPAVVEEHHLRQFEPGSFGDESSLTGGSVQIPLM